MTRGDRSTLVRVECLDAAEARSAPRRSMDLVLPEAAYREIRRVIDKRVDGSAASIVILAADGVDGGVLECTIVDTAGWAIGEGDLPEPVLRARSRLRHRMPEERAGEKQAFGDLLLDRASHRVWRGRREVLLSPVEYRLLGLFMDEPGTVFTRLDLQERVWGSSTIIKGRTVDVNMMRLRRGLVAGGERDPIRTVRNLGYLFDEDALVDAGAGFACEWPAPVGPRSEGPSTRPDF